jgi:hypothetical protein
VYIRLMKMHIAAICFNEPELEMYVSQLKSQGFESLSEAKRADDGTYYQAMAKTAKPESFPPQIVVSEAANATTA